MKLNEYNYERIDIPSLQAKLTALFADFQNAKDVETALQIIQTIDKNRAHVDSMMTLSSIRHSIDTQDEFYEAENDFWDENAPFIQELTTQYYQYVLASPFIADLKKQLPDTFIRIMASTIRTFDPCIISDLQEENRLASEYGKLKAKAQIEFDGKTLTLSQLGSYAYNPDQAIRQAASKAYSAFFKSNLDAFEAIYDKLVKVRDTMAKKLGFKSFTELGYYRMNRLDYNQKDVEIYRQQILKEVVPLVAKMYEKQAQRLGVKTLQHYDTKLLFKSGNAAPHGDDTFILEQGKAMYHELSSDTGEFIDFMLDHDLFDVLSRKGKQLGGYCTFISDYQSPFIFANFNGSADDIEVLTHEAGHAFQIYSSRWITIPECQFPTYESCEIHSMSMEFFTWPYMDKFFDTDADKYRYAHLLGTLVFLPYGVLVDHFQHEVYDHPDWTPKQRNQAWRELEKQYMPHLTYEGDEFLAEGGYWYRQGHIFESPFYYIDYTLAQVCALQFWKRKFVDEDPQAWNDYLKICKIGGTQSFLEIVASANLKNPFVEGSLSEVVQALDQWISAIDDSKFN